MRQNLDFYFPPLKVKVTDGHMYNNQSEEKKVWQKKKRPLSNLKAYLASIPATQL